MYPVYKTLSLFWAIVFLYLLNFETKINMPKIIFEINYNIHPGKREEYFGIMDELKKQISESTGSDYSVYENKKDSNNFSEIYICRNEEEYDSLEDNQNEETMQLTQRLFEEFIKDRKVTYITKFEI